MKRKVTTPENHTNPSGSGCKPLIYLLFYLTFCILWLQLKRNEPQYLFCLPCKSPTNTPICLRQPYKIRFIFQYQPPTMNFLNIFFHPKSSSGFLTCSTNLSLCGASDPHLFAYFFIWQILILSSSFLSSPLNFGRTNSIIPAAPPLKFTTEITVDSHHPKHRRMKINI